MAFGSSAILPILAERFLGMQGLKILDLGIGFGMYGALVRNYADRGCPPWGTYLMGVEAFHGYRNPCWDLYSYIHVMPIGEYLYKYSGVDRFNCAIMLDVIEHMPKKDGIKHLETLKGMLRPSGTILVATPAVWIEQGNANGNEAERHISLWEPDDFTAAGFNILLDGTPDNTGQRMILAEYKD